MGGRWQLGVVRFEDVTERALLMWERRFDCAFGWIVFAVVLMKFDRFFLHQFLSLPLQPFFSCLEISLGKETHP
jgi:uncharacterized membrane protein YidH (DUF202 family)